MRQLMVDRVADLFSQLSLVGKVTQQGTPVDRDAVRDGEVVASGALGQRYTFVEAVQCRVAQLASLPVTPRGRAFKDELQVVDSIGVLGWEVAQGVSDMAPDACRGSREAF
jgi:hypothetical protein